MSETTCACGGTGVVAHDAECKHESQTAGGRACTCTCTTWVAVFPHGSALVAVGVCWQHNQVSARCDFLDQAHTPSVTPAAAERWARWTEHGQQVVCLRAAHRAQ